MLAMTLPSANGSQPMAASGRICAPAPPVPLGREEDFASFERAGAPASVTPLPVGLPPPASGSSEASGRNALPPAEVPLVAAPRRPPAPPPAPAPAAPSPDVSRH